MKHKLVYIEWIDASTFQSWAGVGEISFWFDDIPLVHNVGFVIKETPKYLVMAPALSYETDHAGETYLNTQRIPKGWIKKYKELKI